MRPIWRKKLNPCNTSNELNMNSPKLMSKPLTPHHEPSQENNHLNQALPNAYIKDTPTSPQVVTHPPFPMSPINSHDLFFQMFRRPLIILKIVQVILFIVDSGCTKHMTGNLKLLCNFIEKNLGIVRFGNDQFDLILGYGDLVQGNIMIKRVYYVEGLNHNLFSVGQFCDANLEVAFQKSTCFVRDLQGNDLFTSGENLDKIKEKRDPCILVEYSTQSKGHRVYNKRTRLIVESIHLRFYEIKEMTKMSVNNNTLGLVSQRQKASDYDNSVPAPQLQNVCPLVDTTIPSQQELELLFGPLYDEFFNAGTSSVNKSSSLADSSKQQDTSPTTNIQPSTESKILINVNVEENNNNQAVDTQTKDHPLKQVRKNPSKPVQTRRQLTIDPELCMFALTVSTAKPKNIKDAMADSAWIEAMQEELHQFDR
nr:integrase, catalytic region, zinc finger, CCHC-type, peptidase aspartic, catalytic [Tanacetum cinerariifolium]